ncbi:MAG: cell wall-binding repeat-containing protein [Cenarchaeum sp. SB0669_bin_11]|nr:cell wall-binding repeat-containing protein [Acidimicrobiales bacterium]MYL10551.1 cell wall-binding repeat-containing protein [Cenarchaeum sp. SB0669_bin_11]
MTIRTKRRGRRSLAAILAAMLMASVLAVVAGTPAQAANTSGEYLTEDDEREFAGSDRYQTALKLATRFADDRGGIGSVTTAFIASGESLVDAVSVSGLAGFMDAPVLLTRSDSLHGGVADFLEDYGIGTLYVLGGTSAVSAGVFADLEGLAHSPDVDRISGPTRYDTSAAIASNLSGESWCGTNENSAIVVNGSDDSLFNAVAIGPVANRLELPVLLTAGDELVDAVLTYIDSEDVEHVVIVGGESSVSAGVMSALEDAGVDTVERIGGDSAGEVSVNIAEVIGGDCADDLSPVSGDTVALINSDSVIDGIPAAPVLADDLDQLGGGLIPILAVGSTLPASVRDHLAATDEEDAAGNKIHLRILAIGGTAAVSDAVMDAATDAAASAAALTVTIGASSADPTVGLTPGGDADNDPNDVIYLHFSDDISRTDNANIRNKLEDVLQVNGVPADISSDVNQTDEACDPDTVTVTLERDLKAGDVISIVDGIVLVGARGDRRTVRPASATVPAVAPDTQRPTVRIVPIIGHNRVYVMVSDNKALAEEGLLTGNNEVVNGENLFRVTSGNLELGTQSVNNITFVDGVAADGMEALVVFELNRAIEAGDRFQAGRGAVEDTAENESQVTSGVPVKPVSKLQVSGVQMGNLVHTSNALALIPAAWGTDIDDETATNPTARNTAGNPGVWLEAKGDGPAAGALGNNWVIGLDRASTHDEDEDAELRVFVSVKDQRILVRIVNGEPTFADLKAELEGNADVAARFNVLIDNEFGDNPDTDAVETDWDLCRAADEKIRHHDLPQTDDEAPVEGDDRMRIGDGIRTGVTSARLVVNFNGYVETRSDAQSGRLIDNIVADTAKRMQTDATAVRALLGPITPEATGLYLATSTQGATPVLDAIADPSAPGDDDGPMRSATFVVTTRDARALPQPRDIVDTPTGFRLDGDGDPWDSDDATAGVQRSDGTHAVDDANDLPAHEPSSIADGYGDVGGENDFNYGSKVRIARNSGVPAP